MYLIENTYSKLRYSSAGLLSKKGWIDSHASYFLTGIMLTALALAFIHSAIFQTVNSSNQVDSPWFLSQNLIKGKGLTACNNDYFPFCKNTSQLTGTENEAQMDSFYFANALHLIFQYPGNYLKLSVYRFLPLWFDTGVKAAYGQSPTPPTLWCSVCNWFC